MAFIIGRGCGLIRKGGTSAHTGVKSSPVDCFLARGRIHGLADAKEKHAMRYTHHRGLAAVTRWVRLKYVVMNLKKLANWSWDNSFFYTIWLIFTTECT